MQAVGDLVRLATAFMMTVSGFVEVVSRALLRVQTISELEERWLGLYQQTHSVKVVRLS